RSYWRYIHMYLESCLLRCVLDAFFRSRVVVHRIVVFFFLRSRRHSCSPLFPYTTLFRSVCIEALGWPVGQFQKPKNVHATNKRRSEEHTSELQSPYDLVCRLLLEKKKSSTRS